MWDNIRQGVYAPRYEVIACLEKDSGRWSVVSDELIFSMRLGRRYLRKIYYIRILVFIIFRELRFIFRLLLSICLDEKTP